MAREKSATQQFYESTPAAAKAPWETLSRSEKAKITQAMNAPASSATASSTASNAGAGSAHVDGSAKKRQHIDGSNKR